MAYTINKYSGATLVVVQDGTFDVTTDPMFVGKTAPDTANTKRKLFVFVRKF